MNILNISIDKTLVGGKKLGDAIERHRQYGDYVDHLDILVFTLKKEKRNDFFISKKVIGHPTNSKGKWRFFFDAIRLAKKINQERQFDLVICQDPFVCGFIGWYLKRKYKIKLLIHFHGDFWQNKNWLRECWFNFIFLWLSKFVVPQANAIRVMSQGQKTKLIKAGIKENKIRIISTPVDLARFESYGQAEKEKELLAELIRLRRDSKVILMVGRKDPVKDFDTLFKAMNLVYKRHPEAALWLVGNYTNYEEVKDRLNLPSERVMFAGMIDSLNLPAYYKISYLTVLSSTSESFGKVLIEANACGKPVVSTATTGAKEIVQDGENGFLAPIGDYEKLAEKIFYLLENSEAARKMGETGRKLVQEKFSNNLDKIIQFWYDIINNKL